MVTIITDATPFFNGLLSTYTTTVQAAKTVAINSLESSLQQSKQEFNASIERAKKFILDHPINMYVDGVAFRNALSLFHTAVDTDLGNALNQTSIGYSIRKNNIQLDFNQALSDATDAFNDSFYTVVIDDPNYTTKYDAVVVNLQTTSDSVVGDVTNNIERIDNEYSVARGGVMVQVTALIKDHVFNRPLVRPTGKFYVPSYPNFGVPEEYGLELRNIGTKQWVGSIGVTVTDEYYKSFIDNEPSAVGGVPIRPGESGKVARMITVPKVIVVEGENRNFGKSVKYKLMINTMTS